MNKLEKAGRNKDDLENKHEGSRDQRERKAANKAEIKARFPKQPFPKKKLALDKRFQQEMQPKTSEESSIINAIRDGSLLDIGISYNKVLRIKSERVRIAALQSNDIHILTWEGLGFLAYFDSSPRVRQEALKNNNIPGKEEFLEYMINMGRELIKNYRDMDESIRLMDNASEKIYKRPAPTKKRCIEKVIQEENKRAGWEWLKVTE